MVAAPFLLLATAGPDDEPRAVVVAPLHGIHLAAVDGRREELLGLDGLGIENDGAHAARRGTSRDGIAEVARRRAGQRIAPELRGLGGRDSDDSDRKSDDSDGEGSDDAKDGGEE